MQMFQPNTRRYPEKAGKQETPTVEETGIILFSDQYRMKIMPPVKLPQKKNFNISTEVS